MIETLHLAGTAALIMCVLASAGFCLLYHLSAPWWRSAEGVHLMTFTAALAVIFGWLLFRNATATHGRLGVGDEITRTGVYGLVAGLLLWRVALLWRRQIQPVFRRTARPRSR